MEFFSEPRHKLAAFGRPLVIRHAVLSIFFFALYILLNRSDILMETQLGFTLWYPATGLALALQWALRREAARMVIRLVAGSHFEIVTPSLRSKIPLAGRNGTVRPSVSNFGNGPAETAQEATAIGSTRKWFR